MPISLCLQLVLLALSALLGCASRGRAPEHQPWLPSPAVSPASASPTVELPVSAAAPLLGDVEAVLLARLASAPPEQGLELFFQTFRAGELSCNSERFSAIHSAGRTFTRSNDAPPPSALASGSFTSRYGVGRREAVHGVSSVSVLIDGSEWFFSRSECLKHLRRSPPFDVASEPEGVDIGRQVDGYDEATFWYHAGKPVSVFGRSHAWLNVGDALYQARFYSGSKVAWLEGPLNQATVSEHERRGGVYPVRLNEGGFEIGSDRFCRQLMDCPCPCAAEAPNQAMLKAAPRGDLSDFARQFWDYQAPLFVPLRDSTGIVCKELRLSNEQVSYEAFGRQQAFRISRRIGGFDFWPLEGKQAWPVGSMTVHARDERSFWLNGSPWYFELQACDAAKASIKPANFRGTDTATLADPIGEPRLRIANEYFALENEPSGAACRRVTFHPLLVGGRLSVETATEVVEKDYDFYPDGLVFWFGPLLTPELRADQRYRGTFVVPRPMRGGVSMDGVPWLESLANCKVALARRPRAKTSSTSFAAELTAHAH